MKKYKKNYYIQLYIKICIIVYEQFFYIFQNLFFSKMNNTKIISLIIFLYFHMIIIISITLKKNNFAKEIEMYEHVRVTRKPCALQKITLFANQ